MYDNKTNEELIELLEEKDEKIDQLKQEVESITDGCDETTAETHAMYEDSIDRAEQEELAKKSFYAGYNEKYVIGYLPENDMELVKAWLNYKIGERL